MSELHVVFGAGPLGRAVAEALLAQGREVVVVSRSGKMEQAPGGVKLTNADLYDAAAVRSVAKGAAAAYQCAQPEYTEWPQKFPPLQAAIIDGLAGTGTKLVIGENLYMYGEVTGRIHEGLPYSATTRKGRVRAQMAEAALAAHREGRVPVALARGSDFFGPWVLDSLFGDRVFAPALKGKAASFAGNLDAPHTATYIKDFGRALAVLGERDEALGRVWHVPNDCPELTQRQFGEMLFREIGAPARLAATGRLMMAVGGLFIPAARESLEMMYEFEKPFVVDSSQFERTFGMRATPIQQAIAETVEWYRNR
ncbi:MAG: NAD-dependent epimerase/dehydratase family protein [Anaerolineae bacterium]|jgi:nucleoside-diphosphate-sugar epimerase|nr:NAD-dependent epimerase/dehydratase family protein [Anaerolineae bacterium]